MRSLLCLLLVCCAVPAAAQTPARYRLIRDSQPAGQNWWENGRTQDLNAEDVICDLPPAATYTTPGFRIADPDHAGQECQWTAPAGAEVFLSMLVTRAHTFYLSTRPDPWTPWSAPIAFTYQQGNKPGQPLRLRVVIPGAN